MTITLRHATVADARHLCLWAPSAGRGDQVLYHIGNLALDRVSNPRLNDLADTVTILSQARYISTSLRRISLAHIDGFAYFAVRTGEGRAPQSIIHGRIRPILFIALEAVHNRLPRMSAHRAICRAMACPEQVAREILAALVADDLLSEDHLKGWQVSAHGREMLM